MPSLTADHSCVSFSHVIFKPFQAPVTPPSQSACKRQFVSKIIRLDSFTKRTIYIVLVTINFGLVENSR